MRSSQQTVFQETIRMDEVWSGFKQLLPISILVIVFGAAFSLAAMQEHLSNTAILSMSIFVFAGASQFGALELWGHEVHVIPLVLTVFAINARHLLMGATLYPWLRHLPPAQRYGIMAVVSDSNWAMAVQAFESGQKGYGLVFGGGLALWLCWILGSWIGIYCGNIIANPKVYGLDMVMGCFLTAMVFSGRKTTRLVSIWIFAAVSSLLAYEYLPKNSHVVVGAIAGGLLGMFWIEKPLQGKSND